MLVLILATGGLPILKTRQSAMGEICGGETGFPRVRVRHWAYTLVGGMNKIQFNCLDYQWGEKGGWTHRGRGLRILVQGADPER